MKKSLGELSKSLGGTMFVWPGQDYPETREPNRTASVSAFAVVFALIVTAVGPVLWAHQRYSNVTWAREVRPILERRCVSCHKPDGFGPMALETYQQAREWGPSIKVQVLSGSMPPWAAARGFGEFSNNRSLTQTELDLLTSWTDGGMPEGTAESGQPIDAPASRQQPDLILEVAEPQTISKHIQSYVLSAATDRVRWISGWEFRPGNGPLIERATIRVGSEILGSWVPPEGVQRFPPGAGMSLPMGARLTVDVNYRKVTKPEIDRSAVALWFAASPPRMVVHSRAIQCGTTSLSGISQVLAILPRASSAGAPIEVVARNPDGHIEPFVVISRFNPVYQATYRFRKPIQIGRGTTLDVSSSEPSCGAELTYLAPQR